MTEQIATALSKLDVDNNEHWTADGQPKIEAVRLVGGLFGLKREDVTKAAPNFSRTNPSLDPVDQGVVKPTPIVPFEGNSNAPSDQLQSNGDSAQESESELEGSNLETQLSRARSRLDAAKTAKHQADAECREAEAEVDRIIEAGAINPQGDSFHDSMTRHLIQQQKAREKRGEQLSNLRGIDLKSLIPERPAIEGAIARQVIANRKARAAAGG